MDSKQRRLFDREMRRVNEAPKKQSATHFGVAPGSQTMPMRLISFLEHPLFLAAFGLICSATALIYPRLLFVCGVVIMLAFHRAGVVKGKSWEIQTPSYVLVFVATLLIVNWALKAIKSATHIPSAGEIASLIPTQKSNIENDGFIQFEEMRRLDEPPAVGSRVHIEFYFANRGGRPVEDVQSWGSVLIVDSKKFPPQQMKHLLDVAVHDGYRKFKDQGNNLGVDQINRNTAVGVEPISEDQARRLRIGEDRMFYNASVAWITESGENKVRHSM